MQRNTSRKVKVGQYTFGFKMGPTNKLKGKFMTFICILLSKYNKT